MLICGGAEAATDPPETVAAKKLRSLPFLTNEEIMQACTTGNFAEENENNGEMMADEASQEQLIDDPDSNRQPGEDNSAVNQS